MDYQELEDLPDNISICIACDKHVNDNGETQWDRFAQPYCMECYKNLPDTDKVKRLH